ncbi:MAG TPA: isoprenylcysteine carboxylmethyltransferase family protein [Candidatus Sulfopaludibacter sp.]|jgi:protein-S-isoprenylcysteine O-methyltransferase Ste14|nr:isoprenylcysteine carboxylmethyltransferase family protein [Candidatus Sulfopaludibacter sp.]
MSIGLLVMLLAGWLLWMIPFIRLKRNRQKPARLDRRARWGIVLEAVAYWLLWISVLWRQPPALWRIAPAAVFFGLGAWLSWAAVGTLGKQWRIDAGLNADHELVRTGPYRLVRHPIYASMLCTLLGTGTLLTPLPILAISLVLFLVGTEIRVRVEDGLLESRFGDEFRSYRATVSAYVPFVR